MTSHHENQEQKQQSTTKTSKRRGLWVFLLVGIAIFGVGCVGTITTSSSGKVTFSTCEPSLQMDSSGHTHVGCNVRSTKAKAKKAKKSWPAPKQENPQPYIQMPSPLPALHPLGSLGR